ncbi:YmaF family protein [Bacillus horti]|uniref:YmaF family protein n=1 Tax=Caldalkalibacillus horti TaxID=77523 RepID=A0ABT9W1I5_9BACI|nr:YmaF family protein [Bacillus horti]MDQ0167122.1 hypothetical protein [Bacillus horti]
MQGKNVEERPVYGIVVSSGEQKDGEHTHDMYLISWDGRQVHVHNFKGVTSFDVGHRHRYVGTTAPAPSGVQHTHAYQTTTSYDDGHTHVITGRTGPAVPLSGGGHFHYFEGVTTVNGRTPHTHRYSGRTSDEF